MSGGYVLTAKKGADGKWRQVAYAVTNGPAPAAPAAAAGK
jgi:hypothetical protein